MWTKLLNLLSAYQDVEDECDAIADSEDDETAGEPADGDGSEIPMILESETPVEEVAAEYGFKLESDGSKHIFKDAAGVILFFAEDFATYGSDKGFVKVTCRNKAHPHCGCWVQPRGSNKPKSGNSLLSDCIRWATDGHSGTSLAHRQTAFDVKVKYGMKPKGGRPF